jgi:hypothetical protein
MGGAGHRRCLAGSHGLVFGHVVGFWLSTSTEDPVGETRRIHFQPQVVFDSEPPRLVGELDGSRTNSYTIYKSKSPAVRPGVSLRRRCVGSSASHSFLGDMSFGLR